MIAATTFQPCWMRGSIIANAPPPCESAIRRPGCRSSVPPVTSDAAASPMSPGKRDHLLELRRADEPVLARRPQRVNEDRGAERFGRGEESVEPRIADRDAVHVARDLDARELETLAHVLELGDRGIDVLQRHRAEPVEPFGRGLRPSPRSSRSGAGTSRLPSSGEQPVGQELRHRRQHLPRDPHARPSPSCARARARRSAARCGSSCRRSSRARARSRRRPCSARARPCPCRRRRESARG